MGFFSSIVKFVKNIVKSVLGAIAKFMNAIFGSPVVAALAMLVIAIVFITVPVFATYLANPALLLVPGEGWLLASLITNALIQVVSLVCPALGRALGYAFGLFSFFVGGLNLYTLYADGTWTGLSLLSTWTSGLVGTSVLTATDMYALFSIVSLTSWVALVTGLADGVDSSGNPKSPFVQGYVDGFFAVPEVGAEIADSAISALTSSVGGLLLLGAGVYFGMRALSDSKVQKVSVVNDPGQLTQELAYGG